MKIENHPTVRWYQEQSKAEQDREPSKVEAEWVKQVVLEAGADDVGIVEIDRPQLADQREDVFRVFPKTKALISMVVRLNRENVRSLSRSASDLEFIHCFDAVNTCAHNIIRTLREKGVGAMNTASGFPMDLDHWPGKMWPVSHKSVAEAAGMGLMGRHRIVIHPRFGS